MLWKGCRIRNALTTADFPSRAASVTPLGALSQVTNLKNHSYLFVDNALHFRGELVNGGPLQRGEKRCRSQVDNMCPFRADLPESFTEAVMHGKHVGHFECCSESDLVEAAKAGVDDALERLFISYPPIRRIIRSLSRQYDPNGRAGEELEAAARLGLVEAIRRFEPAKGVKFTTFAFHFVRGAMLKALYSRNQRREWAAGRQAITCVPFESLAEDCDLAANDPEAELARRDDQYGIEIGYAKVEKRPTELAVRDFVAELPPNQRGIVQDVFWNEMSHAEAARQRGVSRPAVSRTLHRVFKRGESELGSHSEAFA